MTKGPRKRMGNCAEDIWKCENTQLPQLPQIGSVAKAMAWQCDGSVPRWFPSWPRGSGRTRTQRVVSSLALSEKSMQLTSKA